MRIPDIKNFLETHYSRCLWWASAVMGCAAIARLLFEFHRLMFALNKAGAVDIGVISNWTRMWFAGEPVYGMARASYPPASYPILWVFWGWADFTTTRRLWTGVVILCVIWLIRLAFGVAQVESRRERLFVALLILSSYSTNVAIGNGQLILLVLPLLMVSMMFLASSPLTWRKELLGAFFFLVACVKPSITVPFFWLAWFLPQKIRPAALIVAGYALLTFLAALFQKDSVVVLLKGWFLQSQKWIVYELGYASIPYWLKEAGLQSLVLPVTLIFLVGLGAWLYFSQQEDFWIRFGVTSLVARLWTYHNLYDDLLTLIPILVVFRMVRESMAQKNCHLTACLVLGLAWGMSLVPAHFHAEPTWPGFCFRAGQTLNFLILLGFLLWHTQPKRTAPDTISGAVQPPAH